MSRMFEKMEEGQPALGTISLSGAPEWVEILGNSGLDFVCADLMITALSWREAADLVRAAKVFDVTPWVRVQGYPWDGGKLSTRTVADVFRAVSIGAECVTVSVDTAEEVEAILHPRADPHRRPWLHHEPGEVGPEDALIFPMIESAGAARNIEEILSIPDLQAIFLALGDLPTALGHPGEVEHPEVRGFIERTVEAGRRNGVTVMSNVGYYDTPESIAGAAKWLWDAGIPVVWLPYPEYLADRLYRDTIGRVKDLTDGAGS
jgi:2-keto-3-deoxy-L-rhamnonate aldolase RhmA